MTERVWVLPDEPAPVRLMNTLWADRHQVHDALESTAALAEWLTETQLVTSKPRPTAGDLAAFLRLRDALRRLAAEVTIDDRSQAASPMSGDEALAAVNQVILAAHLPPSLLRGAEGLRRSPESKGGAVPVALATVALAAVELLVAPSRLRACFAPGCVLYFAKDHPRREWCSDGCGNRVRAARHYARTRDRT